MILIKRDYEREGVKVVFKGSEADLAIEMNAMLIFMEEHPEILALFAEVSNVRKNKLIEEQIKNDQNNTGNES